MKLSIPLSGLAILAAVLVNLAQASQNNSTDSDAWERLANGTAVAIMRHALAPGFSDPAGFELSDCTTQRNLSIEGREQARAIGNLFREKGIGEAKVRTSQWCRCKDTAKLLNLGTPTMLKSLNSFFENRSAADSQTHDLEQNLPMWIQEGSMPTVLVTHQVNISALTQQFTNSGEILIISLEDEEIVVLDSISTLN